MVRVRNFCWTRSWHSNLKRKNIESLSGSRIQRVLIRSGKSIKQSTSYPDNVLSFLGQLNAVKPNGRETILSLHLTVTRHQRFHPTQC